MEKLDVTDIDDIEVSYPSNTGPPDTSFSIYSPRFCTEPANFGISDLHDLVEKSNKTQKIAAEAFTSLSHLIKNANSYVMEMQLLEDLENLIKDNNGTKKPPSSSSNLLSSSNWAKLYGLDTNEDITETYSKIRQNIQQLVFESDLPVEEESVKDNSTEKNDKISKTANYPLKRALRYLRQEQRPQSTSAIERIAVLPVPKVRGITNSRQQTSRNELQPLTSAKKSSNMPPRNAVSEEDASKLSATEDNRFVWADCESLWPTFSFEHQNQQVQNRRNLKDLISVDYLPKC